MAHIYAPCNFQLLTSLPAVTLGSMLAERVGQGVTCKVTAQEQVPNQDT